MAKSTEKVNIWFPVYTGDYVKITNHFSATERGAWFSLKVHYWASGNPLPDDDVRLSRITGQSVDEWQQCRPVIAKLFQIEGGLWHSEEIEQEIEEATKKRKKAIEKAKKAGLASGKARQKGGLHVVD